MSFGIGNHRRIAGVIAVLSLVGLMGCSRPTDHGSAAPSEQTGPAPVTAPSAKVVQADPKWFSCEHASQCSVQQGPCDEPQAVNSTFTKPFLAYRDSMNQMVDCQANPKKSDKTTSFCKSQRCSLTP